MAEPFIGSISPIAFDYAPRGFAFCDGRLLLISQNVALYSLLGSAFGGDAKNTFGLPDLRSRAALGAGFGTGLTPRDMGDLIGTETVTITLEEMPAHTHQAFASSRADSSSPEGQYWGSGNVSDIFGEKFPVYGNAQSFVALSDKALQPIGSNRPHNNMSPYLAANYIIALSGIFPMRG